MSRHVSHIVWGNLVGGYFGLVGAGFDFLAGGAWRLEPAYPRGKPPHVHVIADPHPWESGTWRGSLALTSGFKRYPGGQQTSDRLENDLAVQMVLGHKNWPVELEGRGYFYSSLPAADGSVNYQIAEGGVRKTLLNFGGAKPYISGGLNLLAQSTQENGGFPLGVWARAGLDVRAGRAFFVAPYLGYSKYETVATGINTGGLTGGLIFGMLW
jgi:hypothetical protein